MRDPLSGFLASQIFGIGGLRKVSLMLRQRQHTVPTSAYSTIIEILQLLQTVVTIGS